MWAADLQSSHLATAAALAAAALSPRGHPGQSAAADPAAFCLIAGAPAAAAGRLAPAAQDERDLRFLQAE